MFRHNIWALLLSGIWFAFLFFSFSQPVFAVTVSITSPSPPIAITNDAFTLTASISGASTGTNYLRVDIYKDGTVNYFGETFNNSDWYNGSDGKQYLPISVQSGSFWNGTIQARIGSPSTAEYDGIGSYKARIRRYTSSGYPGSEDANNSSVAVVISIPTSTPTPSPTPTSTPTSTPTKTPTPTLTSTPSPTIVASITSSATSSSAVFSASSSTILGESTLAGIFELSPSPKKIAKATKVLGVSQNIMPMILLGVGIMLILSSCGILAFKIKKNKWKNFE